MPEVFVLSGPDLGRSFEVSAGSQFGRAPECAVRLRDKSISRNHAHLELVGEGWVVVDDGSRNGLYRDDQRLERAELEDGAELRLGEVRLRFRLNEALAESEPSSSESRAPELALPDELPEEIDLGAETELGDEIDLDFDDADSEPEFVAGGGAGLVQSARTEAASGSDKPAASESAAQSESADDNPELKRESRAGGRRRKPAPAAAREPGNILQYHQVEQRSGLLGADLGQYSLGVRVLVFVGLTLLAGGLAWLAFRGTAAL